jgi:hypothetical protein
MPMRFEKPSFPLTRNVFAAALRTGHGRARQQIDRYGSDGLEDTIIKACLTCLTYDPQCEAARAPWLVSIVERAELAAKVVREIEAMVQEPLPENQCDMDQRCAILKEIAAAGSDEARRVLYTSLVRLSGTSEVVGAEYIVALDGVEGLIRVARQLGRWLQADPDFRVHDWLLAQFDESTRGEEGRAALEHAAKVDKDVAGYLAGIRKASASDSAPSERFDPMTYSGTEIVSHVSNNPKEQCHWFRRWGAQANDDQRQTVFEALLSSDDPEQVKRLLRCFSKTGVPRFDNGLVKWLDHPDKQVQWAAVRAVAPTRHAEWRKAALRLIAGDDLANGITLLVNNFEVGDFALCAEHLKCLDDPDAAHHLVGELLDLCEAHPGADALNCLLYVYELSPCSTCRRRAVKALTDTNTAPAWILEELEFDADPDTQSMASYKR